MRRIDSPIVEIPICPIEAGIQFGILLSQLCFVPFSIIREIFCNINIVDKLIFIVYNRLEKKGYYATK